MLENLIRYYEQEYKEDERLIKDRAHAVEFLTTVRYFDKVFPRDAKILDACAGTGAYSFYLAKGGHRVTAGDIVENNVSIIKEKQAKTPSLFEIYNGSVLDLSRFEDESFDVVLCMGAMYHLKNKCDREKAIEECLRVLKNDGIIVLSYINKYAVILNNYEDQIRNMDELLQYNIESHRDIFYATTPKEITTTMKDNGVKPLHNIATDGIGYLISSKINNSSEENYEKWLQLHFETCEEESLLGYSLHGLFIGSKTNLEMIL